MNIKSVLFAVLAGSLVAVGCNKEEDPMALKANIEADVETLEFEDAIRTKTFQLTSTRDWKLNEYEAGVDWVTVTPESGMAAVKANTIDVTVKANAGNDRETILSFTNGTRTIGVKVYQKGPLGPGGDSYSFSFASGLGEFTVDTKKGSAWVYDSKYSCAKATGKSTTTVETDTYLVSPEIDLTNEPAAFLNFTHASYSNKIKNDASVLVRKVGDSEWTALDVPAWPSGYTFVPSGEIDLTKYLGSKIEIAFRFTSTSSYTDTWEIQSVSIARATTPVVETSSISEIRSKDEGAKIKASDLTVQAVYNAGVLVSDGKDYLLIYFGYNTTPSCKVGDVISLDASLTFYTSGGGSLKYPQLINPENVTVTGNKTVTLPNPVDITSTFGTFDIDPAGDYLKYYKVSGKISVSGNYVNFTVGEETARTGSLLSANADIDFTQFNGVECTICGFFIYSTGASNQYINFLVTDATFPEGFINISPATQNVAAAGGPVTLNITTAGAWNIDPVSGISFDKTSGTGDAVVTVTLPENKTFDTVVYTIVAKTATGQASAEIKQAGAQNPDATVVELTNDEIVAFLAAYSGTNGYAETKLTNAAGDWNVKINLQKGLKYLQIRNKENSRIETPLFAKEISKIEFTTDSNQQSTARTLHVLPIDYELPDSYKENEAFLGASLGSATCEVKSTNVISIDVKAGHKQVKLCAYDGAMYISSIKVYLK